MILPWYRLPSKTPPPAGDGVSDVTVVGAGLAGCWIASELAERGRHVTLVERSSQIAAEASAAPAAVVKPFVTRNAGQIDAFYAAALAYLQQRLASNNLANVAAYINCGVLQLSQHRYPSQPGYVGLTAQQAAQHTGSRTNTGGILFKAAGWLNPRRLCKALCEHPNITLHLNTAVLAIEPLRDTTWQINCDAQNPPIIARQVVWSAGAALANLPATADLPLQPVRGQLSRFALRASSPPLRCVISGNHFVIPADQATIVTGATFDRGDTNTTVRLQDHQRNLAALHVLLPELQIQPQALTGFAGVRATTPDRLPIVGPMPRLDIYQQVYATIRHGKAMHHYPDALYHDNLSVLGGLGSRGSVTAPFCAALLADWLCSPQPQSPLLDWITLLHPARFCIRQLKV